MKRKELLTAVKGVYLSEKSKRKIIDRAKNYYNEKESIFMARKKVVALLVASTILSVGIVFAGGNIVSTWYSSSSAIPEYTKLPTKQECIDDIGYTPVLIEKFANDYSFKDASLTDNTLNDEQGNDIEKFKSFMFRYFKGDDEILLSIDKYISDMQKKGDIVKIIDGVELYYTKHMNKFVPPDYEMTEEDKMAEEKGELVFSYGSVDVEILEIQNLKFNKDGIEYTFTQIDGEATLDELISMAEEIIID